MSLSEKAIAVALSSGVIAWALVSWALVSTPPPQQVASPAPALSVDQVAQQVIDADSIIFPDVPGVVNPGITQENMGSTICAGSAWSTKSIRPSTSYTGPIKVTALARYNKEHGTHYALADGELDHLISIELAGSPTDSNNLWFEPYITQIDGKQVGAHEKDKVENYLHAEVCAGKIMLAEAQKEIASDWYNVYTQNMAPRSGTLGSSIVSSSDPDDN